MIMNAHPSVPIATKPMRASRSVGDNLMDTNELIVALEEFKGLSADITVASVLTLLYIGRRGISVQKDIERELGLSNASASRNVNYWCQTGTKGFAFVERYEDPDDRRHNRLRLTREGAEFYERLRNPRRVKSGTVSG